MARKKPAQYFPSEKILKPIRDKLSAPNYEGGSIALPPNPSELQKAKYELCQMILKFKRVNELTQRKLAEKIEVDEARVSDILRGKISSFTLDRLLGYASKLHPGIKIKITA